METFIVSIHAPTEYTMIGSGAIVSKYWALTTAFCAELIKKVKSEKGICFSLTIFYLASYSHG